MDFVALDSASTRVSMAQGSFYSFGAGAADITLVRLPRTAFRHVTERTETRSTDVGASQMIIDGKIKLKNDAQISRFTEKGLEFDDGSTLDADAVVFATGWVHPFIYFSHVDRDGLTVYDTYTQPWRIARSDEQNTRARGWRPSQANLGFGRRGRDTGCMA
jgi:hypothetical protein